MKPPATKSPATVEHDSTSEPAAQASNEALGYVPYDASNGPSPEQALAVLRVLWGILLVGQLLLIGIAGMVMQNSTAQAMDKDLTFKLFGFNAGLLVFNIMLGTFLRSQIYKRCWRGDVVSPLGYFTANMVMLGLLEMVIFFGILISILDKSFMPSILPSAMAMLVYGVNFPHGGPMFGGRDPASINFTQPSEEAIIASEIPAENEKNES